MPEGIGRGKAGGYFVDLGVSHPAYAHGFLAGIECDGASYQLTLERTKPAVE
ncbi:hypothetical protein JST97_31705 [bacterium]|nr:hypothetical protein [bacterium]